MKRAFISTLLSMFTLILLGLAGCGSSDSPAPSTTSGTTMYYSEQQYRSGVIKSLSDSYTLITLLEPPGSSVDSISDTGAVGHDEFISILTKPAVVDLCVLADGRAFVMELYDAYSMLVLSMTAQPAGHNCTADTILPVTVPSGIYSVRITHDGKTNVIETLHLTMKHSLNASTVVKSADSIDGITPTNLVYSSTFVPFDSSF